MSTTIVMHPYLYPLLAALFCLLFWKNPRRQFFISIIAALGTIYASFKLLTRVMDDPLMHQMGGWPAPFGIVFVIDAFSATLIFISSIVFFFTLLHAHCFLDEDRKSRLFYFLANVLFLGCVAAFSTSDIFNLFVSFELLLISSFVLLTLGKGRSQIKSSLKYVTINIFSSICFLCGIALIYSQTGALNMGHIAALYRESGYDLSFASQGAVVLFFIAFAIKTGLFPLFFWLPSAYPSTPSTISALFAGLLTKVGAYSLIRFFTLIFPLNELPWLQKVFFTVALLSMLIGVFGALSQMTIRKILSIHIISQIGYVILGLAIYTPLSIAAAIFYLVHNMLAKTNLFFCSGLVEAQLGTDDLKKHGGFFKKFPFFSFLFLVSALALAGIPPLSGFFAKLLLAQSFVASGNYIALLFALGIGVLTLLSMLKIWNFTFLKKQDYDDSEMKPLQKKKTAYFIVCSMTVLICFMGLASNFVFEWMQVCVEQMLNPDLYFKGLPKK